MKVYTLEEMDSLNNIEYPYIEKQTIHGQEMFVYISSPKSEDWYGYKGHLRRINNPKRSKEYLSVLYKEIYDSVKVGDVVFDCGANEGYTSLLYSKWVGPSGLVIAFEPDKGNVEKIKKQIEINNIKNIIVVNKAITDISGQKIWFASEMVQTQHNGVEVETVCLDDYIRYKPDYIKIDVEGYELPVLKGSSDVLKVCRGLVIETHLSQTTGVHMKKHYGFDPNELYKILREAGFKIECNGKDVNDGDEFSIVYCSKRS